jgi:hypothetical protein
MTPTFDRVIAPTYPFDFRQAIEKGEMRDAFGTIETKRVIGVFVTFWGGKPLRSARQNELKSCVGSELSDAM